MILEDEQRSSDLRLLPAVEVLEDPPFGGHEARRHIHQTAVEVVHYASLGTPCARLKA